MNRCRQFVMRLKPQLTRTRQMMRRMTLRRQRLQLAPDELAVPLTWARFHQVRSRSKPRAHRPLLLARRRLPQMLPLR